MALLHDIIAALLDEKVGVGTTLLKLRFLASRLGSAELEEWVKFETEGFPAGVEVPEYRKTSISYSGTFTNGVQVLNKISVPEYIVKTEAGEHWVRYEIRDGLSVIDEVTLNRNHGKYGIDASNLKLLLDNKVYKGFSCVEIDGVFDLSSFVRIQHAVRAKVLDLVLEIEKKLPDAAKVEIGERDVQFDAPQQAAVNNLTHQIFYGSVTNISSSGDSANLNFRIEQGSKDGLSRALSEKGIPLASARELAEIIASEPPGDAETPLREKALDYINNAGSKGIKEVWSIAKPAAIEVAKAYARQFWGL